MLVLQLVTFLLCLSAERENLPVFRLDGEHFLSLDRWQFVDKAPVNLQTPSQLPWLDLDRNLPARKPSAGAFWLRARILLLGSPKPLDHLSLFLSDLEVPYEVFWDGLPLTGRKTAPQNSTAVPIQGPLYAELKPEHSQPGEHQLLIRLHLPPERLGLAVPRLSLAYAKDRITREIDLAIPYFIGLGFFFFATLLATAFSLGSRQRRAYLFLSVFFLLHTLEMVLGLGLAFAHLDVLPKSEYRLFSTLFHPLAGTLLALFLLFHFRLNLPRRHVFWLVPCQLAVLLLPAVWCYPLTHGYPLVLGILAVKTQRVGAFPMLLGLLTLMFGLVLGGSLPLSQGFYLAGLDFFMLLLILAIALEIRAYDRLHQKALLHASRLEAELLKKNIQPHFIMNTLLSLISLIEDHPHKAKTLVRALAGEFRLINKMASKNRVALADELALCREHLKIMGLRKDADYSFTHPEAAPDFCVPPLLFHTLVENALTHAYAPTETGRLSLHWQRDKEWIQYEFRNDGSLLGNLHRKSPTELETGMGLNYLKARLEESYPARWSLEFGLERGFWVVHIKVPAPG